MHNIDFKSVRHAVVYLRDVAVGILKKQSEDTYSFQYSESYINTPGAIPIARLFPIQANPFMSTKLHPFFDNLIAEGWLLEYAQKIFHIDKTNRFALLMATGKSPIGAVSIHALNDSDQPINTRSHTEEEQQTEILIRYPNIIKKSFPYCPTCLQELTNGKAHRTCAIEMWGTQKNISVELQATNPLQSFARVIYGGSISGAQRKGMFCLDPKTGSLKSTPTNSQYILKPDGNFPELPLNEHVTMAIARACGFRVPPFSLLEFEKVGYVFAIKRFDRVKTGQALMMEDMGQIIGIPSTDKYESSCEKVATAISQYSSAPTIDLVDYFRRILFCYLTANADMHLKNWSLLENEKQLGTFILSPCYDLLCTRLPIPDEKIDIGLPVGGKGRNLQKSYFIDFSKRLAIPTHLVEKSFQDTHLWARIALSFIPKTLLARESKAKYLEIVKTRADALK